MLVAAYLIAERGKTADEAMMFLKERRPVVHFEDTQVAFLREREVRKVNDKTLFACKQCGFKYQKEEQAQACEDSCANRGICRTDLAKQAIKP